MIPDTGFLTVITLRLIQKLCLLYGFQENGTERRTQMWMAAASAAGVDFGKDIAEKQMVEKLAPRIATRLAVHLGEESAEKWVGRLVPLASSAIGGALNYSFVKSWGRRVQRHLREKHLAERAAAATNAYHAETGDRSLNAASSPSISMPPLDNTPFSLGVNYPWRTTVRILAAPTGSTSESAFRRRGNSSLGILRKSGKRAFPSCAGFCLATAAAAF